MLRSPLKSPLTIQYTWVEEVCRTLRSSAQVHHANYVSLDMQANDVEGGNKDLNKHKMINFLV